MPSLGALTCTLSHTPTDTPLIEHALAYHDKYAECLIAVPEGVGAGGVGFSIRLQSHGYIAPGLAMFVYIDGVYQVNRNRTNLLPPAEGVKQGRTEIDFTVRQKEERTDAGLEGRAWKFERCKFGEGNVSAPMEGQHVGLIEVVVLRCEAVEDEIGGDSKAWGSKSGPAVKDDESDEPVFLGGMYDGGGDEKPRESKRDHRHHHHHRHHRTTELGSVSESPSKAEHKDAHRRKRKHNKPENLEIQNSNWRISGTRYVDEKRDGSQSRRRLNSSLLSDGDSGSRRSNHRDSSPSLLHSRQRSRRRSERSFSYDTASTLVSETRSPRDVIAMRVSERGDNWNREYEPPVAHPFSTLRGGGSDWDPINNPTVQRDAWGDIITTVEASGESGQSITSWYAPATNNTSTNDWGNGQNGSSQWDKEPEHDENGGDQTDKWDSKDDNKDHTTNQTDANAGEGNAWDSTTDNWASSEWNTETKAKDQNAPSQTHDPAKDKEKSDDNSWSNHKGGWGSSDDNNDKHRAHAAPWENEATKAPEAIDFEWMYKDDDTWRRNGTNNDGWGMKHEENNLTDWDNDNAQKTDQATSWNEQNRDHDSANGKWNENAPQADQNGEASAAKGADSWNDSRDDWDRRQSQMKEKNVQVAGSGDGDVQLGASDPAKKTQRKASPKRDPMAEATRGRSASEQAPASKEEKPVPMSFREAIFAEAARQTALAAAKTGSTDTTAIPGSYSPPMRPSQNASAAPQTQQQPSTTASATTVQPTKGFKLQTKDYWSTWRISGSALPTPSSQENEPHPLYTLSSTVQNSESITHQTRPHRPAPYRHKVQTPRYIDTHEDPYAVFAFKYRDKDVVEKILGYPVAGLSPEDEEKQLWALTKAELVEEVKRLRISGGGSTEKADTGAKEAKPGGWHNAGAGWGSSGSGASGKGKPVDTGDWARNPRGAGPWRSTSAVTTSASGGTRKGDDNGNGDDGSAGEWNDAASNDGGGGNWGSADAESKHDGDDNGGSQGWGNDAKKEEGGCKGDSW